MNPLDDESYTSFRCRHNLTLPFMHFLTRDSFANLLASTRQLVLTNSQMIKTWVADWPLHSHFTSSLWWSKMKTTSICPSSRYDDNSFIPWSRCSTTRQCRLFSDSDWYFESILKSSLHLLSHGLDHSLRLVFSYLLLPQSLLNDVTISRRST